MHEPDAPAATDTAPPPAPPRGRRRTPWVLLAVVAGLLAATAAVVGTLVFTGDDEPTTPATFTISGTMQVHGGVASANGIDGEACSYLPDGYSDVPGAQVVVTDPTGRVIATGQLAGTGRLHHGALPGGVPTRYCAFAFEVAVPDGHDFYGVEVGHRGRLQYARDKLRTPITLTLGN